LAFDNVFTFRGIEMHGCRMWRPDRLAEALEFAAAHDLTALILHDNSIIHESTFPKAYFNDAQRTGYAHVRRYIGNIYSKQAYLRNLLKHAKRKGIEIWVEVKEIEFPDEVLERFPQLCKNGIICPTDPVWFEYLQLKTAEFFELFPDMSGIILSPGSPESRAFLSTGKKCTCSRCQATDFGDWCYDIIMSIYTVVQAHGKKLAVRDFVYTPEDHERLAQIISRTPKDIIFAIKNTPRDFWPTFPHNPMLGRFKDRTQWVEYDTFGQFYGWGVCPAIMLQDLRERLLYAKSQGVSGVMLRTEWEGVDISAFDSLNKINLIAGAQLAKSFAFSDEDLVLQWLREANLLGDTPESQVDVAGLTAVLLRTWPLIRNTIYLDDFVFHTSSQFPIDVNKAWYTMLFYHSLATWDNTAAGRLSLDYQNIRRLLSQKEAALRETKELLDVIAQRHWGLAEESEQKIREAFQFYDLYVRGFVLAIKTCLLAKALSDGQLDALQRSEFRKQLEDVFQGMEAYIRELQVFETATSYPFYIYLLFDYRNVSGILEQARAMVAPMPG
jgi:hypothetical protein